MKLLDIEQSLLDASLAAGFDRAGFALASKLRLSSAPEIRALCEANACGQYGGTWACPPAIGTVEECVLTLAKYPKALVVQSIAPLEDSFDLEGANIAARAFRQRFRAFIPTAREYCDTVLPLAAGGCDLCDACTYPDAPCRRPGEAVPSVEGYGINVLLLCKRAGLPYHSGANTVTYTGALFLE